LTDQRRLVRIYLAATGCRRRVSAVLGAVLDGVWLGAFDREGLAALDETHYARLIDRARGSAFSYSDETWNTSGLQPWEAVAVDGHFPPGGRVVVTGAGGGREVLALLERGFDAVGFEPQPDLVSAGRGILGRRGAGDRVHHAPRDAFPAQAGPADAVLVGWGSYMLMPGRARRIAFLGSARAHLPEGAPVILSFFVRSAAERDYDRLAAVANLVRRLRRAERVEVGDALRPNYVHLFTREEIAGELHEAGFTLVAYRAEPYGHAIARATRGTGSE
jgi:hypothetical protein